VRDGGDAPHASVRHDERPTRLDQGGGLAARPAQSPRAPARGRDSRGGRVLAHHRRSAASPRLLCHHRRRRRHRGDQARGGEERKGGIKYRYYLSSALLYGQPGRIGSVRRVPAADVEALVGCAVREHLGDPTESEDRDFIRNHVVRVQVQADQLAVELKAEKAHSDPPNAVDNDRLVLRIPWKKTPMKRRRDIIVPASVSPHDRRPIRAETRATLVASIARGRRWLDEIVAGTVTGVEQIAARAKW